jgi:D-glycero-D-manno-heptose 1,7-bisphosphate phosphatase
MPDIFLDRDGVINRNRADHVKTWREFEFLPGSLEALVRLHYHNYRVFVITNQAVISRGLMSHLMLKEIHTRMQQEVFAAGGRIEAVLYCPHHPEDGCDCRKPQPGLIYQAEKYYGARVKESWLVGDHISDIMAGNAAGCRTIMVMSGRATAVFQTENDGSKTQVVKDLSAAVNLILG